jgi:hypothetical protein
MRKEIEYVQLIALQAVSQFRLDHHQAMIGFDTEVGDTWAIVKTLKHVNLERIFRHFSEVTIRFLLLLPKDW